jgi:DNA-binding MarR family transcriptional regulator
LPAEKGLTDADYAALADFRHAIRAFQAFSEERATKAGLTPQQHQALLAVRGAKPTEATVGYVAERLIIKPNSATGLIDRLEALGLIVRESDVGDRRRAVICLTAKGHRALADLSEIHREEIRRLHPHLAEVLSRLG